MNRSQEITKLTKDLDLLVIGGGATGAGVALDAISRGLRVGLVEKSDFASGTSSKSTKLIHGGVRYLEQAVLHLDRSQFRLVRDALRERKVLLQNAPHLVSWLPLLVPMYRRLEAAYYHAGLRMYDWLAGKSLVYKSRIVSKAEALKLCPHLRSSGLRGGVIYYDGQFDDARMNIALLLKAQQLGAGVLNYTEVTGFEKKSGKITHAQLRDRLTGKTWSVATRAVVNATGPLCDTIRAMDNPKAKPLLRASSGTHVTLEAYTHGTKIGVLIPKTTDKRVLFVLPWLGKTLVGTTDQSAKITERPEPTPADVEFILKEYNRYFEPAATKAEILSSWTGLRPLVNETNVSGTAGLSRDHVIEVGTSGMITICGGKWTTYRLMAEDTVNRVYTVLKEKPKPCTTEKLPLAGAENYSPSLVKEITSKGLAEDVATHLCRNYGSDAAFVASYVVKQPERLSANHPYTEGEVRYAIENEAIHFSSDFLSRRTRLALLDYQAAGEIFPKVHEILKSSFGWDEEKTKADKESLFSLTLSPIL